MLFHSSRIGFLLWRSADIVQIRADSSTLRQRQRLTNQLEAVRYWFSSLISNVSQILFVNCRGIGNYLHAAFSIAFQSNPFECVQCSRCSPKPVPLCLSLPTLHSYTKMQYLFVLEALISIHVENSSRATRRERFQYLDTNLIVYFLFSLVFLFTVHKFVSANTTYRPTLIASIESYATSLLRTFP